MVIICRNIVYGELNSNAFHLQFSSIKLLLLLLRCAKFHSWNWHYQKRERRTPSIVKRIWFNEDDAYKSPKRILSSFDLRKNTISCHHNGQWPNNIPGYIPELHIRLTDDIRLQLTHLLEFIERLCGVNLLIK